jgi:putative hemolysin
MKNLTIIFISLILISSCFAQETASTSNEGIAKWQHQGKINAINDKIVGGEGTGNPSCLYAADQGYPLKTVYSPAGESNNVIFPDNTTCDEWAFFLGKCGQKWSYCEQHGGKIVNREGLDDRYLCSSFAVCVFPDGSECLEDDYCKGFCKPGQKYKIQNQTWDKLP